MKFKKDQVVIVKHLDSIKEKYWGTQLIIKKECVVNDVPMIDCLFYGDIPQVFYDVHPTFNPVVDSYNIYVPMNALELTGNNILDWLE